MTDVFKAYYCKEIVEFFLANPSDPLSLRRVDGSDENRYGKITTPTALKDSIFRCEWILANRDAIHAKVEEWRKDEAPLWTLSLEEEKIYTQIQMDSEDRMFSIVDGLCESARLFCIRGNLRDIMNERWVEHLEEGKYKGNKFLTECGYPIPGGCRVYDRECEDNSLWDNPDRWDYVEFVLDHLKTLLAALEN